MRHLSDDVLDDALRMAAARLRDQEIAGADTDDAWARFETQQADEVVVPVRASQAPGRHRGWVSVAAIGLAAASTLVLVWLQSRPAPENPVDLPTTTVPVATSTVPVTTSTTQTSAVQASSALVLPTFPRNRVIESLSTVSDAEWYALTDGPPGGPYSYPQLWHTVDAGATWVVTASAGGAAGGDWVHFADPLNGWLMTNNCCIVATHDGGDTWKPIDGVLPRGDDGATPAIASFGGRVYIMADVPIEGNSRIGVMSSPVETDDFVWSGSTMGDVRWGLTPTSGQLVGSGESGWAIAYGATSPEPAPSGSFNSFVPRGAARLVDGEWTEWTPPCTVSLEGEPQLQTIELPRLILGASRSGGMVAVVCSQSTADKSPRAFVSADDGVTFLEATRLPNGMTLTDRSWLIVPDDDTILVGVTLDTGEPAVAKSDDRGTSWIVDTTFSVGAEFTTATITPTGRVVVVATIDRLEASQRNEAQIRDNGGTWLLISSA